MIAKTEYGSYNIILRGLILVQKIDEPDVFTDSPYYIEINKGFITFFNDWVLGDSEPHPFKMIDHKDMQLACLEE
jgi:hypothetical protein